MRRPGTFLAGFSALVLVASLRLWKGSTRFDDPDFGFISFVTVDELCGMADEGQYRAAAGCAIQAAMGNPAFVNEDLARFARANGESVGQLLSRWRTLPGPAGSPGAEMRDAATQLEAFLHHAQLTGALKRKPITGWRHRYFTWRANKHQAAIAMATSRGIILEWRTHSFDTDCWPTRSFNDGESDIAEDWNERFWAREARVPKVSLIGMRAGTWSSRSSAPDAPAVQLTVSGRYVFLPYWLIVLASALLPARACFMWIRGHVRRRRGRCSRCGYDLRASPALCPECGLDKPSTTRSGTVAV